MNKGLTDISFYKEIYDNELEQKSKLTSLVVFPTTLLSILIGGAFYLYEPYLTKPDNYNEYLVYELTLLSILFVIVMCIIIFFLMRLFHNDFKKYEYLPLPKDLYAREKELFEHYKNHFIETDKLDTAIAEKEALSYAKDVFNKDLLNYYIKCATHNQLVNEKRYKQYYKARSLIFVALGILAISGILIIIK